MEEYIGNVRLDYDLYPGEDYYTDGDIEEELLQVVQQYEEECFDEIIRKQRNWPFMYHLSKKRQNIIEWFPFERDKIVLEIGAGCGAITGILAEKTKFVTCIELSKRRSLINAYRNKKYKNIEIKVGNFKEIESVLNMQFDYITLIGVLEYAKLYMDSKDPFVDFLKIIARHLKKNGQVLIAIENRLGMKYWAGCQEDHLDKYYVGIEGYKEGDNVRTFSKSELENIILEAGFKKYKFYYPYPDYKFPDVIYSDSYLPKKGELSNNNRNLDKTRLKTFKETNAFDSIIKEKLFPQFSNSYLVILKKE